MIAIRPGAYARRKLPRSSLVIGARRTRSASSRALGGGNWLSTQTERSSIGMNSSPVAAGIQKRSTCQLCISQVPADLTTPDDRMKLAQSIDASTSEMRRPSMKP